MDTKFSIIIPAYNVEKYIKKCLDSILNQTYKSFEVIIIDDASTDNTYNIISQYDDPRIKIIQNETNLRQGTARNKGMEIAEGEYIIFVDADDYYSSDDVIEKINNVIGDEKCDIVFFGFKEKGGLSRTIIPEPTATKYDMLNNFNSTLKCQCALWNKCFNRKFLKKNKIKFTKKMFYEDNMFSFKAIALSNKTKVLPEVCYIYVRGRKGSSMTDYSLSKVADYYKHIGFLFDLLNQIPEDCHEALFKVIKYKFKTIDKNLVTWMDGFYPNKSLIKKYFE